MKTPHGVKEYNYNTQMFKLFHPKKETIKGSEREKQTESIKQSETKTKRQKKIYPSREAHQQGQKRPGKNQCPMLKFLKPQHQK